ncbi:hypothetical protein F8M41_019603 [Gigaspora margarita]|uniref:Uncharacterized protein n=1 Tax=Gigaspora margarita TaxID=4874 RepID=A0A8H4EU85_GIGMA|nr:hypothetical protein F8M41_019603 [Gigaspora margarita]
MIDDLNNNIEMRENDFIIIEADRDKYKEVFERRNDTISELEQHGEFFFLIKCLSNTCVFEKHPHWSERIEIAPWLTGLILLLVFNVPAIGFTLGINDKLGYWLLDPSVIRELDGALTQPKNSEAIGIVVIFDDS